MCELMLVHNNVWLWKMLTLRYRCVCGIWTMRFKTMKCASAEWCKVNRHWLVDILVLYKDPTHYFQTEPHIVHTIMIHSKKASSYISAVYRDAPKERDYTIVLCWLEDKECHCNAVIVWIVKFIHVCPLPPWEVPADAFRCTPNHFPLVLSLYVHT